jgi:hypothetical protein
LILLVPERGFEPPTYWLRIRHQRKSYVSRTLWLALLAPEIIEAILSGRTDQGMTLEQLERPLPALWEDSGACSD